MTLDGWDMETPSASDMPFKGNTAIGNDLWIEQNAVILPGVNIVDGAIIGANSVCRQICSSLYHLVSREFSNTPGVVTNTIM